MNDEAIKQQLKSELQHQKMSTKKIIKRAFFVLLGAIMMALGIEVFLVPNMIMDGGIVGISIILYNLTGIKLGVFIFLLNIPFFFLGYKQIGKTFAVSTVFGITILSLATNYLHTVAAFTSDMLLATVFGGIVLGAGVGLVIRYGGALDGSEILAILLNKRFPFPSANSSCCSTCSFSPGEDLSSAGTGRCIRYSLMSSHLKPSTLSLMDSMNRNPPGLSVIKTRKSEMQFWQGSAVELPISKEKAVIPETIKSNLLYRHTSRRSQT